MTEVPLAVVIPAFRRRFLAETLESLAAQTDRSFRVYVADDGSPEPLAEVVAPFAARLDLVYRRFPENLGIAGLVAHWHRAIELSSEPWVWLFSDDDLAAPDCVAAWHRHVAREPDTVALLRFDLESTDAQGSTLRQEKPFPEHLSASDYARRMLTGSHEGCIIQNIVFRRTVYEAEGGFAVTVGGFCSDNITWPRFARAGGVTRIRGGRVRYRYHDATVGAFMSLYSPRQHESIEAYRETVLRLRGIAGATEAAQARWRRAEMDWFASPFRYLPRSLRADESALVRRVMAELWPEQPVARFMFFWCNYARVFVRQLRRSARWPRRRPKPG